MPWIESHADLRDHPKLDLLSELLGIPRRDAVGLLHFVWWRALTYAEDGDLTGLTDGQLARWADWDNDPRLLVSGLQRAGFLDAARKLHHWHDYAGKWVERREADKLRKRSERASSGAAADVRPTSDGASTGRRPESGVPDLTGPNRTGPDTTGTPHSPPREGGGKTRRRRTNGLISAGQCHGCGADDHRCDACPKYGAYFRQQDERLAAQTNDEGAS